MLKFGLIREGKIPPDNRVALTPAQCKWLQKNFSELKIVVQHSNTRCFTDQEYIHAGIDVREDLGDCDILLGIKEVPVEMLIEGKTYMFFSHTRKMQDYNKHLFRTILEKKITLIDYECLEHEDGQRVIGFGFFAGIVGAHNGIMAYGIRKNAFKLGRVYENRDYRQLIHTYFGLKLPNVKIAVTGSGRVAHGVLEVMNLMGITEVEPDEYVERNFTYPVYVQLRGNDLYTHKQTKTYKREMFHTHPAEFRSRFLPYTRCSDILMNGIYWTYDTPRLFEPEDIDESFTIETIADISDDAHGSVPINLGDQTIENPVYGVDKKTRQKTEPYLSTSIDVMAVGNLPNELPRDASRYFGEQLIKYILEDIIKGGSKMINNATIVRSGIINEPYLYMTEYAGL